MTDAVKTLRLAAVQMESKNSDIQGNLERATHFVDEAARRGARLIVLPEFMPTGYIFAKQMWEAAEPREGLTVRWLGENSRRLGLWLGTSYLEAEGEDFYNTFVLTNPLGKEDGRVRKQTPALSEAYFFRGQAGPHVIDTELGKIGVGICYENQLAYTPQLMYSQAVDLQLMPHSAPSPMASLLFPAKWVAVYNETLKNTASYYASMLGIPEIFINKCGPWISPMPGRPFHKEISSFPGFSTIVDSDGTIKAQLGSEEAVLVEDVVLDPAHKTKTPPVCHGRWARKLPWAANYFRLVEAIGSTWYKFSSERKRRAKEISS